MDFTLIRDSAIIGGAALAVVTIALLGLRARFGESILTGLLVWIGLMIVAMLLDGFVVGRMGLTPVTFGIGATIGVVTFSATVVAIMRQVIAPVRSLSAAARKIAIGDLSAHSDYQSKDEIGELAAAFREAIAYQHEKSAVAERISTGDLTQRVLPKSEQDELGRAFARMVDQLRDLVGQVVESAADAHSASQELASAAEQAGSATSQVSGTVQQLAQGTVSQAASTAEVATIMDEMARRVQGVARDSETQARAVASASEGVQRLKCTLAEMASASESSTASARQVTETAQSGADAVRRAARGIEAIRDSSTQVGERVQEMGRHSEQIGQIVETIQDIADQTNLLALNAAIEAARAGEQGRGFAVVADEVRKLAEKSASASQEIAELVRTVQKGTVQAIQVAAQGDGLVADGVAAVREAGQVLETILAATEENNRAAANIQTSAVQIQQLTDRVVEELAVVSGVGEKNSEATREMSAGIGEVTKSVDLVAATAEENSASVEEVAASAEELSAQVEGVSASTRRLSSLAQALQASVSTFRLQLGRDQAGRNSGPHLTLIA